MSAEIVTDLGKITKELDSLVFLFGGFVPAINDSWQELSDSMEKIKEFNSYQQALYQLLMLEKKFYLGVDYLTNFRFWIKQGELAIPGGMQKYLAKQEEFFSQMKKIQKKIRALDFQLAAHSVLNDPNLPAQINFSALSKIPEVDFFVALTDQIVHDLSIITQVINTYLILIKTITNNNEAVALFREMNDSFWIDFFIILYQKFQFHSNLFKELQEEKEKAMYFPELEKLIADTISMLEDTLRKFTSNSLAQLFPREDALWIWLRNFKIKPSLNGEINIDALSGNFKSFFDKVRTFKILPELIDVLYEHFEELIVNGKAKLDSLVEMVGKMGQENSVYDSNAISEYAKSVINVIDLDELKQTEQELETYVVYFVNLDVFSQKYRDLKEDLGAANKIYQMIERGNAKLVLACIKFKILVEFDNLDVLLGELTNFVENKTPANEEIKQSIINAITVNEARQAIIDRRFHLGETPVELYKSLVWERLKTFATIGASVATIGAAVGVALPAAVAGVVAGAALGMVSPLFDRIWKDRRKKEKEAEKK
jgi:hypothetical protein